MVSSGSASISEDVGGRPLSSTHGGGLGSINRKRKSDGPAAEYVDLDDYDVNGMRIDKYPDQVRRQIRRFLENGGMKVGEFCNGIGVSNGAYNRFMQQKGPTKGLGSDVYQQAWAFFAKREMAGLKMPTKKQKIGATSDSASSPISKAAENSIDISGTHLDGGENDNVPVYESCVDVRKKINAYMGKQGITKAQFCRDLHAQLQSSEAPLHIKDNALDAFRDRRVQTPGARALCVFCKDAAYCFFEKRRLAEDKAKSKHRTGVEGIWPSGVRRDREPPRTGYLCHKSKQPHEDKYGRVSFS